MNRWRICDRFTESKPQRFVSEFREDLSQSRQRLALAEDTLATAGFLRVTASTIATTER